MQNKLIPLLQFIKKHKERVALIGMGLGFVIFIGGGVYLQKNSERERELRTTVSPLRVELEKESRQSDDKSGEKKQASQGVAGGNSSRQSYFLKPSPSELLEQLTSLDKLTDAAIDAKYQQMPVLWKVYFFSFEQREDGRSVLLLDVSEDGFGVVIESEAKVTLYPELLDLVPGEIVWVGGKVLAIDRSGTGTIYLKLEQLKMGAEPPFAERPAETTQ